MKTNLHKVILILALVSSAILATIYLIWLCYPLEISYLGLEKVVYMKAADISYNFNRLMVYLTNPFEQNLVMPSFSSSRDGLHHFEQVKWLFHLTQAVWLLSFPTSLYFYRRIVKKGYGHLYRSLFLWSASVPLLIGFLAALIGFDTFFVLFHQILFVGDQTWLFNPLTDPVIYILPQEFFLHCFFLCLLLYEVFCGMGIWLTRKKENVLGSSKDLAL